MVNTPNHLFCDTVTIERSSNATGTMGGIKKTWSTHLSGVKVNIQTVAASELRREGRDASRRIHRIYTAAGQDIQNEDRVQFDDWDNPANIFSVNNVLYQDFLTVIECEEEAS